MNIWPMIISTIKLTETYEKILLGTAGTLLDNQSLEGNTLMAHVDNITTFDLRNLVTCRKNVQKIA